MDCIDVGVGTSRFWIFSIADVAITAGALLLALTLFHEGNRGGAGFQ